MSFFSKKRLNSLGSYSSTCSLNNTLDESLESEETKDDLLISFGDAGVTVEIDIKDGRQG